MRIYEIDSGNLKDCERRGATIVKVVTLSDVLLMLDDLREKTKIIGKEHTGMGLIRHEIIMIKHELKGGYDE